MAGGNRVRLDLNNPEFQDVFFRLQRDELKQVVASLRRLSRLDWRFARWSRRAGQRTFPPS